MAGFTLTQARSLLGRVFAPWVQALNLSVESIEADGAILKMPGSPSLAREGGVISGQALMALADTAMVFAVSAACGGYRPMTTVDQTSHFLKPATGDIIADARIIRLGKTMAFGRVTLTAVSDGKPVALATSAYALL